MMLIVFGVAADEEPVDIEDVPTPTSLPDLLPEGGIEAVNIDYWMTMRMYEADGRVTGDPSYYYWSIKPADGNLVFIHRIGFGGANGFDRVFRSVYTAEGKLVSYRDVYHRKSGMLRVTSGKIEGDKLILQTAQGRGGKDPKPVGRPREVPLSKFDEVLPGEFEPLVLAYHIRRSSLGYGYTAIYVSENSLMIQTRVEDLGVEKAEVDGQTREAHFLRARKIYMGKNNRERSGTILVLEDGTVLSMRERENKIELRYTRSSAEQVYEQFGLDNNDLPEAD